MGAICGNNLLRQVQRDVDREVQYMRDNLIGRSYFNYLVEVAEVPHIDGCHIVIKVNIIQYTDNLEDCINSVKQSIAAHLECRMREWYRPNVYGYYPIYEIYVNIDPVPQKIEITVGFDLEEKEDKNMKCVPEVREIIHRSSKKKGEVFTVKWEDGTETSVKLKEGEVSDEYVAFMYCVSIKMFGSKGDCRKYVKAKKEVFNSRVQERSRELRENRERVKLEQEIKKTAPYVGGLIIPQLSASSMFKKNGGQR